MVSSIALGLPVVLQNIALFVVHRDEVSQFRTRRVSRMNEWSAPAATFRCCWSPCAKGIPARARGGFGMYFIQGRGEDHWVGEYWHAAEARWVRVDAQIDEFQRERLQPNFHLLDVPHDRFVIAGDAWAQCRCSDTDPATFGVSFLNEGGLWFIAGNLLRDFAALNSLEMLPWDVWGTMPGPDEPITEEQLALFDYLAALTPTPDASFDELRALYTSDDRLRVPATVFNAVLNRLDTWAG
jgi:hypothetical protein